MPRNKRPGLLCLTLLLGLSGCLPWPWTKTEYAAREVAHFTVHDLPDPQGPHGYLWVNQAFVKTVVKAHDQTSESGSAPYRVNLSVYGQHARHTELLVHQISAKNGSGQVFTLTPIQQTHHKGQTQTERLAWPVKVPFKSMSEPPKDWSWASLSTEAEIYPAPPNNPELQIEVELTVADRSAQARKTLSYTFVPQIQQGWFRSLD